MRATGVCAAKSAGVAGRFLSFFTKIRSIRQSCGVARKVLPCCACSAIQCCAGGL
ncbi:hypothetical protein [Azospirillum argentinense]